MKPIEPPLLFQDHGSAVANLQAALQALSNFVIVTPELTQFLADVAAESARQLYGEGTRGLVALHQELNDLPASGEVDAATAQTFNNLLQAMGGLESVDETARSIASGRISARRISGPPRLRVVAVDKNVGGDALLGDAMTGADGAYTIRYDPAALRRGKASPDLQVYALDQDDKILAASAVRLNAGVEEKDLNIAIPAKKLARPIEYRLLLDSLGPHLDAQDETDLKNRLAALQENQRQQDITYLAHKTGWDARLIAMAALASRFEQRSGIAAEFFYALFRADVPPTEAALGRMLPEKAQQAWERAIKRQIIPPELSASIPDNLQRFKTFSTALLLGAPSQNGLSTFRELISGALADDADQQRFAELYYDQRTDLTSFWDSVRKAFPGQAERLEFNSQLAFLTINNAPLIQQLHARNDQLRGAVDLVRQGLYRPDAWKDLLENIPIPAEIPGATPDAAKDNYAAILASQVRRSEPAAVAAAMIRSDALLQKIDQNVKDQVAAFLDDHHDTFDLGVTPVGQFVRRNNVGLDAPALAQVEKLQRLNQISPSEDVFAMLESHDIASAADVASYDQQTFVDTFQGLLGGEQVAELVYAKAHQVHHAVLNLTAAYLLDRTATPLYAIDLDQPARVARTPGDPDVPAYPTLEKIFGEMDYCECEDCRSWLSPAAYFVDLLHFLDPPSHEKDNPLDVLLSKRPDLQHIELSCENTNVILPYIDLVNEILEHYVVHRSLEGLSGHNIEAGVASEELLASPQFVDDAAYLKLRDALFPPPLPFHQPLEALRQHFDHFGIPLHIAMERLRANDQAAGQPYGWQDALMERLRLSRKEYGLLTGSEPLPSLFGESANASEAQAIERLSNAKIFARRMGLAYEDLFDILRTQFINPGGRLAAQLERLGVKLDAIRQFLGGTLAPATFAGMLPADLDAAAFGGDAQRWLKDHQQQLRSLIALTGDSADCSFDAVEMNRPLADGAERQLKAIDFVKLLRFVRLQRKLGWSARLTDKAISALFPREQIAQPADDQPLAKLNAGFATLVQRLAHLKIVSDLMGVAASADLEMLLACWSDIDTFGGDSLYRQLFLSPAILALSDAFLPDDTGAVLAEKKAFQGGASPPTIAAEQDALRAAFNLTQPELDLLIERLKFDDQTILNLQNISRIFRHGFLARTLKISVRELLDLKELSGLDPFLPLDLAPPNPAAPPGAVRPAAVRFIELVQRIEASPFSISRLLYYLRDDDPSGNAAPSKDDVRSLAQTLREDLKRVEQNAGDAAGDAAALEALKRQQILQTLGGKLGADITILSALLENAAALHAQGQPSQPAIVDFLNISTPAHDDDAFYAAYIRFLKALAIVGALGLSNAELEHFAAHADYAIGGQGWLNALPALATPDAATAGKLLEALLALVQYRLLKDALKISDDRLASALQALAAGADGMNEASRATGWPASDIAALAAHFGLAAPDLAHLHHFARLYEAIETIRQFGASAGVLVARLSNEPSGEALRDIQAALRARYDPGAWLTALQSINNQLRTLQRDALVAYVLHDMSQDQSTQSIDTPEKLFERFLIDVEMDPVMQTSRIRQAIASVQLFIQRCLLNLETRVAPSSIKAGQWEWMKRYRVWEANRKVFLFPENWLDPELRDDKTPFFKDLESELLQSDITDDAAANALVHYLEKLDDIARLEICGMYFDRNELGNDADDVVHVIGRTAGARRAYYYRRQEGGVAWSPWEKIDLSIEDDPVLPVVWKGRLFLFWLGLAQENPTDGAAPDFGDVSLVQLQAKQLRAISGRPTRNVAVNLYWSEYYHGKWQPPHVSNMSAPLRICEFDLTGIGAFDRAQLTLWTAEASQLAGAGELAGLIISVFYQGAQLGKSFKLYTTHSLPDASYDTPPNVYQAVRAIEAENATFVVEYLDLKQKVLFNAQSFTVVEPGHAVTDTYEAPFFYQDRQHVFFVKPRKTMIPFETDPDAVPQPDPVDPGVTRPVEPVDPSTLTPDPVVPVDPVDPDPPDPVDPVEPVEPVEPTGPIRPPTFPNLTPPKTLAAFSNSPQGQRSNITKAIKSDAAFSFDDTLIGASGSAETPQTLEG